MITPVLMKMDGRDLSRGTVFLWNKVEHTVTDAHESRHHSGMRATWVETDKGEKILFTENSNPVTAIL